MAPPSASSTSFTQSSGLATASICVSETQLGEAAGRAPREDGDRALPLCCLIKSSLASQYLFQACSGKEAGIAAVPRQMLPRLHRGLLLLLASSLIAHMGNAQSGAQQCEDPKVCSLLKRFAAPVLSRRCVAHRSAHCIVSKSGWGCQRPLPACRLLPSRRTDLPCRASN